MRAMFRFVAILAVGLLAAPAGAQERPALDTEKDKLSYAIGADLGKDLRDRSIEVTPERLEARAHGLDAAGRQTAAIEPTWIPKDPDVVVVSPTQGHQVNITVRSAGQSSVTVAYGDLSKTLAIKAEYRGDAIQAQISQ